jgi:bifunctional ADP-heptose synthase (sugar kinase/adenylyltransferase)
MRDVRHYADAVIPFDGNPIPLIQAIRPDRVLRGWDQKQEASGCEVVRIERYSDISTTSLYSVKG